ncbi:hypothetical protein GCM10009635_24820 [Actinocatenispora thailandica]
MHLDVFRDDLEATRQRVAEVLLHRGESLVTQRFGPGERDLDDTVLGVQLPQAGEVAGGDAVQQGLEDLARGGGVGHGELLGRGDGRIRSGHSVSRIRSDGSVCPAGHEHDGGRA